MKQIHQVTWQSIKHLGDNIWATEWEEFEHFRSVKSSIVKAPKANQPLLPDFTPNPNFKK